MDPAIEDIRTAEQDVRAGRRQSAVRSRSRGRMPTRSPVNAQSARK